MFQKLQPVPELLRPHLKAFAAGLAAILLVDVLQLATPRILQMAADHLQSGTMTQNRLLTYGVLLVLFALAIALLRFAWRYFIFGISKKLETAMRNQFYSHLQTLPASYFNENKTGDLMSLATSDIGNVRMAAGQGVALVLDSTLIPLVAFAMMFATAGPWLTLICASPLLLLAVVILVFARTIETRVTVMQESIGTLTERVRESFSGLRVIRAFVREHYFLGLFEAAAKENYEANIRFARVMQVLFPLIMAVSSLSFGLALLFGGAAALEGTLSLGAFVAFNAYLGMLMWPMAAIGWVTNMLQRGLVSLGRIREVLDTPSDTDRQRVNPALTHVSGALRLKHLSFTYPGADAPALKDISFSLPAGSTMAIVGRTGSGKSTLLNLLSRVFDPPSGTFYLDDHDLLDYAPEVLRSHMGIVPQDAFLFSATLEENIRFFSDASTEAVHEAARLAGIHDNILTFPKGYNTLSGERGVTLSGGQKQRMTIARALLRQVPVLLLDDCLSAVDTQTEEKILSGLKTASRGRTTVIVSHRLSAVRHADLILVLEDGCLTGSGTHSELLETHPYYAETFRKQQLENMAD